MTFQRHIAGAILGIILAAGSPLMAQSSDREASGERAEPGAPRHGAHALTEAVPHLYRNLVEGNRTTASTQDSPEWRFDAGVSMLAHAYEDLGNLDAPAGGWFTVGSGNVRLQVDYWHQQGKREHHGAFYVGGQRFVELETRSSSFDSFHFSVSRHFRTDRRFTPHLLVGGGAALGRGEVCRSAEMGHAGLGCRQSSNWNAIVVAGLGLDISVAPRFFIRVQSRGYTFHESDDPAWVRLAQATVSHLLVGAGVRF